MARYICLLALSAVLWTYIVSGINGSTECDRKSFGQSSFVCKCTASYCDTVPELTVQSGSYTMYSSSMSGDRFKKKVVPFSSKSTKGNAQVKVDKTMKGQTVIGFGGAVTDSAALNIYSLSDDVRKKLIASYFSTDGIEYTVGRVTVASTDFSTRVYSYDDVEGDIDLKYFALVEEDTEYKIPLIKTAKEMSKRPIKLFSTPWGPPYWMKRSNSMVNGSFLKGQPGGQYYKAYANYYIKFLDAYKEAGIDFWGLTSQNEPLMGLNPHFGMQSLGFTPALQKDYIVKDLGPALHEAGYGYLKLMTLDDCVEFLPYWAKVIYDSAASDYVSGLAIHWYVNKIFGYNGVAKTHDVNPDKFILSTEACHRTGKGESPVELGSWERAEEYTYDIIKDLQNWVAGWVDWNIALSMTGGPKWAGNNFVDSPIIVNADLNEFYKQPVFYAMGHFSKFVTPDSIRRGMTTTGTDVDGVAFTTPENQTVIVLYNPGDKSQELDVKDGDKTFSLNIGARSFNTIIYV